MKYSHRSKTTLRRLIDVLGSSILLLLASPLLLATALAIWLSDGCDVFYRQTRVGLHGRPFGLLKFRSMRINNLPIDDVTEIREGHPLVTPVGKWIRRLKIDELPQLLNVLLGDMSLIGPRAGMPEHLVNYTASQRRRLSIRPGLTGWAQVNGGIELTWPERIMLDTWYVDQRGFSLDLKIMASTVGVVLFGEKRNPQALQNAIAYAAQESEVIGTESLRRPLAAATAGDHGTDGQAPSVAHTAAPVADSGHRRLSRVVHLSSAHTVFDARFFHKECRSLAMAGYDVTVIALSSEYGTSQDGVRIHMLPKPRTRFERMSRTIWAIYRAALRENAEIYHFHDPELMPVGTLLRMRGKRVVYDVHEDFAFDILHKEWIPGLLRWPVSVAFRALQMALTSSFDRVIAATPAIARNFPPSKTRCVRNFPWSHEFGCSRSQPYEERDPIAVYIGDLSDVRGIREMRQAVELAAKETPIKLVMAGWVNLGARAECLRDGESELVEFKGRLDRAGVAELLGRARVGMLLFHPLPNHVNAMPHKLFEYLAAGLPVILSDFPSWRELIGREECALFVNPLSPASVAEALLWLFRHPAQAAQMGQNGRRAVAESYNWERESECLLTTYAELRPAGREKAFAQASKEGKGSALQVAQGHSKRRDAAKA